MIHQHPLLFAPIHGPRTAPQHPSCRDSPKRMKTRKRMGWTVWGNQLNTPCQEHWFPRLPSAPAAVVAPSSWMRPINAGSSCLVLHIDETKHLPAHLFLQSAISLPFVMIPINLPPSAVPTSSSTPGATEFSRPQSLPRLLIGARMLPPRTRDQLPRHISGLVRSWMNMTMTASISATVGPPLDARPHPPRPTLMPIVGKRTVANVAVTKTPTQRIPMRPSMAYYLPDQTR